MEAGLHGSGIMSPSANTPESSTMRRRISDSTMRLVLGSKPSLRPASCTGWKLMPRTHLYFSAWRTISPISVSLTPRFTVQTRVVAEGRILGDADAVGVQHHVLDGPAACGGEDLQDLRMDGGLAARDLHQVGLAFASHQGVEHELDLAEAAMAVPLGRGIGEADGTGEIAGLVDLDDGQARMLLVVGAEAAIPGTAALGAGERRQRPVAGLEVLQGAPPVDRVVGHQGLHHAVLGTALGIIDAAVLLDDLGRHEAETGLAERGGLAEEEIRCGLARYAIVHALLPRRIITAAYRTRPRHTKWNRLKGPASVA